MARLDFTLTDASGSYSWFVEHTGVQPGDVFSDEEIRQWAQDYVAAADQETVWEREIEESAGEKSYPCFGYTTADVLQDEEAYIAYWKGVMEETLPEEIENLVNEVKTYLRANRPAPSKKVQYVANGDADYSIQFGNTIHKATLVDDGWGWTLQIRSYNGGSCFAKQEFDSPYDLYQAMRGYADLRRWREVDHN